MVAPPRVTKAMDAATATNRTPTVARPLESWADEPLIPPLLRRQTSLALPVCDYRPRGGPPVHRSVPSTFRAKLHGRWIRPACHEPPTPRQGRCSECLKEAWTG